MVNVCVQHFDLYKLPRSKLTNVNILCLVRFSSDRNKVNSCSFWFRMITIKHSAVRIYFVNVFDPSFVQPLAVYRDFAV